MKSEPYNPFEDDGTGYIDSRPSLFVGAIGIAAPPYDLLGEEVNDLVDELAAIKARRIPAGFQLPEPPA